MIGAKDNSNLDELFKKTEKKEKMNDYKSISKEESKKIALFIKNMHDKLGEDRFNLVVNTVMITAKNKEEKGEKFTFEDLERVLKKALELVSEI